MPTRPAAVLNLVGLDFLAPSNEVARQLVGALLLVNSVGPVGQALGISREAPDGLAGSGYWSRPFKQAV